MNGIPCFHLYFLCLEPTVRKNTWMRTISAKVLVIISKVPFWKLLDTNHIRSSFSTITRHIENGIWKTSYSWRFYGHESTCVLFLSWVIIMKRKWTKVPGNEGACTKIWDCSSMNIAQRHFTYYCIFLFPQTYLVFKSNQVFIE